MSNINELAKSLFLLAFSSPVAMSLIYKGFFAGPQKFNEFKGLSSLRIILPRMHSPELIERAYVIQGEQKPGFRVFSQLFLSKEVSIIFHY